MAMFNRYVKLPEGIIAEPLSVGAGIKMSGSALVDLLTTQSGSWKGTEGENVEHNYQQLRDQIRSCP